MAFIPEEKVDEIKQSVDIVSLISEYVPLKKSGRNYLGLCPFHHEKTPSFTVSPEKGIFHCFGCGAGGDAVAFIMKRENISYPEALRFLADKLGIFIDGGTDPQIFKKKKRLYQLNHEAARFFFSEMLSSSEAKTYMKQRGLTKKAIMRFNIGYAPPHSGKLYAYLKSKGFADEEMLELGLISPSKHGPGFYARFRNRLMFPIVDIKNQIVGFGGRTMVNDPAKYINSQDSILYNKSAEIYGAKNFSDIRRDDCAILVEGYMDVAALYTHDIPWAVASLGTSLTEGQIKLIRRATKNIYIAYDGDEAGQNATEKAVRLFLQQDQLPRILVIPNGQDPDEFVAQHGKEAFLDLMERYEDPLFYIINRHSAGTDFRDVQKKIDIVHKAAELMALIKDNTTKCEYVARFSDFFELPKESISETIAGYKEKTQIPKSQEKDTFDPNTSEAIEKNKIRKQYEELYEALRFMIYQPERLDEIRKIVRDHAHIFTRYEDVMDFLEEQKRRGEIPTEQDLVALYPDLKKVAAYLFEGQAPYYRSAENLTLFLHRVQYYRLLEERKKVQEYIQTWDNGSRSISNEEEVYWLKRLMEIEKKIKSYDR